MIKAEKVGRSLDVTTNIQSCYQIFFHKDFSIWQKVCGIVPRFFRFATNSSIILTNDKQVDGLRVASTVIDKVIIPIADIPLQDEKQSYIQPMLQAVLGAAHLANGLGITQLPREFLYLGEQLLDTAESVKTASEYLCQKIQSMSPIIQIEAIELLNYLQQIKQESHKQIVLFGVNSHKKILAGASAADFAMIPYCLCREETFTKRTCEILRYPVREAVVVKETPTSPSIYYEFFFLSNWHAHGGELPPNWPTSIPFNRHAIVVDKEETAQITEDLQKELNHVNKERVKNQLTTMNLFLNTFIRHQS